jgi:hypothetical protein
MLPLRPQIVLIIAKPDRNLAAANIDVSTVR